MHYYVLFSKEKVNLFVAVIVLIISFLASFSLNNTILFNQLTSSNNYNYLTVVVIIFNSPLTLTFTFLDSDEYIL